MSPTEGIQKRYQEIDAFRGIAILMMVTYHGLFDLAFFQIMQINVYSGFWRGFAYMTAISFIFLVGVSLSISQARSRPKLTPWNFRLKFLKRGLFILGIGLGITVVTYIYPGKGYILFGILHLIGLSIIIAPFFFRFRRANLVAGILVILAGWLISGVEGPIWLAWLGFHPATFYSLDYEPLLPWFGLALLGLFTGSTLYPDGKRGFDLPFRLPALIRDPLASAGRHSLLIYLIHQPVIIGLILVFTGRLLI